jgi:hypothetical protein
VSLREIKNNLRICGDFIVTQSYTELSTESHEGFLNTKVSKVFLCGFVSLREIKNNLRICGDFIVAQSFLMF